MIKVNPGVKHSVLAADGDGGGIVVFLGNISGMDGCSNKVGRSSF